MNIKVIQPDPPLKKEILAEAIVRISEGLKRLNANNLNERGVIVLLSDLTGVGKPTCRAVIDGLARLEAAYCRTGSNKKEGPAR